MVCNKCQKKIEQKIKGKPIIAVDMDDRLLSREEFKESVFKRDNNKCVMCHAPAVDAHHVLDRKLFTDGGYYLKNGASLCSSCHEKAERDEISVQDILAKTGIDKVTGMILPSDLRISEDDENVDSIHFDKWGNFCLYGVWYPGSRFYEPSVQKQLEWKLPQFSFHFKYPKTFHVPWSLGLQNDDRMQKDMSIFYDKEIVVTEKMDGENASLYRDYYHARSTMSKHHPSRNWIKDLHKRIQTDIPEHFRICGENLYAEHSIKYGSLDNFFHVFSIWDNERCLPWDETLEWCELLDIPTVPVLYRGKYDEDLLKSLYKPIKDNGDEMEGYVLRNTDSFHFLQFKNNLAKFVRKGHVQTDEHWMSKEVVPNKLKDGRRW